MEKNEVVKIYFEVTEEGGRVLEFALNVEGDHPWTASALLLHHSVLGVRGQAYRQTANIDRLLLVLVKNYWRDSNTD